MNDTTQDIKAKLDETEKVFARLREEDPQEYLRLVEELNKILEELNTEIETILA